MRHLSWKYIACIALLVLAAGAFVAGAVSAQPYREAATIAKGAASFEELSERFRALAREKGAVYAYDVLRVATLPPGTDLHLLGHVVGEELYAQEGVEGIKECTQEFRNACSHSIVIGTLNEFGAGAATIEKIRAACHLAPGGPGAYTMCFHGLGHGVFAYFGYDIPKAVAFCKELGTPEYGEQEFTQCVGGLTMELVGGGGHDHDKWVAANEKYLKADDPLSPCDTALIPYEAKSFCYSYLTPHLFEAAGADLGNPSPDTFPKAFSFCDPIGDKKLRDVCYGGFGKEFVPLAGARDIRAIDRLPDQAYSLAIGWCLLATSQEAKDACIGQALASVFWGGESDSQASFRFCGLVPDSATRDACYGELSVNIASYTSGERREALCRQLPEADVEECLTAQYGPV